MYIGSNRLSHEHCKPIIHQSHIAHNAHGIVRRTRCRGIFPGRVGLLRRHHQVRLQKIDIPNDFLINTSTWLQRTRDLYRYHPRRLTVLHLGQTRRVASLVTELARRLSLAVVEQGEKHVRARRTGRARGRKERVHRRRRSGDKAQVIVRLINLAGSTVHIHH